MQKKSVIFIKKMYIKSDYSMIKWLWKSFDKHIYIYLYKQSATFSKAYLKI